MIEIGVGDRQRLPLRFTGADDDPDRVKREDQQREKAAARARRYHPSHSTGRPRGRPASAAGPRRRGTLTRAEYLAAKLTNHMSAETIRNKIVLETRVKDVIRMVTRKIDRSCVDTSEVAQYLRPLQQMRTKELTNLLGREFPEWTTLYGR